MAQKASTGKKIILWISLFSISMAFLESAIVIYLRRIYYPYGFDFPLVPMEGTISLTELFREIATMLMLLSFSIIAGKTFRQRFAVFVYCFAVWDIFYYIFLYLLIGWPTSLMTWDILFLIPVTWTGPVITPIIVSFTMIAIALLILIKDRNNIQLKFNPVIWTFILAGSLLLILSFIWDYSSYMLEHYSLSKLFKYSGSKGLFNLAYNYIPRRFNWFLFVLGEINVIIGIIILSLTGKTDKN
jgi:hypothetical protein